MFSYKIYAVSNFESLNKQTMKNSILTMSACILGLIILSSFTMVSPESFKTSKATSPSKGPVTFHTSTTSVVPSPTGVTLFGTVTATGAIQSSGTYEMDVQFIGKAL